MQKALQLVSEIRFTVYQNRAISQAWCQHACDPNTRKRQEKDQKF